MFNLKFYKMKKHLILALFLSFFIVSCEKDDDHDHDECQECHVSLTEEDGTEHPVDIEGEFCGDDLANVEANGWIATVDIMHDGEVEYAADTLVPAEFIHCEEHANHDHDDHDDH